MGICKYKKTSLFARVVLFLVKFLHPYDTACPRAERIIIIIMLIIIAPMATTATVRRLTEAAEAEAEEQVVTLHTLRGWKPASRGCDFARMSFLNTKMIQCSGCRKSENQII